MAAILLLLCSHRKCTHKENAMSLGLWGGVHVYKFIYYELYIYSLNFVLSVGCNSPHQWGCFRCRVNAHRQMKRGHSTQTHWIVLDNMFFVCLSVFLAHECLSTAPLWANSLQRLSVDRVKVSDMFSGSDWPGLIMLIGYPNLLLPCQRCWQRRWPDVRDCAWRVMKKKEKYLVIIWVVWGQGPLPENASSPHRHEPLEVKQQGLSFDLLRTNGNSKECGPLRKAICHIEFKWD